MDVDRSISVKSWFARGWQTFRRNPKPLIAGSIIFNSISLLSALAAGMAGRQWITIPFQLFIIPILGFGWLALCLHGVRREDTTLALLFSAFRSYFRVWATYILYVLLVVAGIFLVIVPGILWALKYSMIFFAVMDRSLYGREAFRFSKRVTGGFRGKLFAAFVLISILSAVSAPFSMGLERIASGSAGLLLMIGVVPLLAGILVITPWVGSVFASAYESLRASAEESSDGESGHENDAASGGAHDGGGETS
jgi:hypothetical protein